MTASSREPRSDAFALLRFPCLLTASLHFASQLSTFKMSAPEQVAQNYSFDGTITKYKGTAAALGGLETQFNVFLPKQALDGDKVP